MWFRPGLPLALARRAASVSDISNGLILISLVSNTAFLSDTVFLSLLALPLLGVREAWISGSDIDLGRETLCAECSGIRADWDFFLDFLPLASAGVFRSEI